MCTAWQYMCRAWQYMCTAWQYMWAVTSDKFLDVCKADDTSSSAQTAVLPGLKVLAAALQLLCSSRRIAHNLCCLIAVGNPRVPAVPVLHVPGVSEIWGVPPSGDRPCHVPPTNLWDIR
jgi:hypothetical protein